MTRHPRPTPADRHYRTTDGGGPNIDPVAQLGRLDMRLTRRGTPEERRAARLAVCANATGPDDARQLLATLGLDTP